MVRLFAALAIPPLIAEGLVRRQTGLLGASWRPVEAFHITLRFFGDVSEAMADDVDSALAVVSGPALDLSLKGVGSFGEGDDIDAIWAGVETNPALTQLARRCENAARKAGLKPDTRTWRPHVTLAYLRRPDPPSVATWEQANNLLKSPPFRVDRFGLYSSHQTSEGSRYRLERDYPLGS
jgi:2'-5' RNA ligase